MRIILAIFVLALLVSCGSSDTSYQGAKYQESGYQDSSQYGSVESATQHEDVEVVGEGDVEIEDQVPDETEEYVEDVSLANEARERMISLASSSSYTRNNGKLKRGRIAKQLNREGYRKSDGSRFRRRDIPKSL